MTRLTRLEWVGLFIAAATVCWWSYIMWGAFIRSQVPPPVKQSLTTPLTAEEHQWIKDKMAIEAEVKRLQKVYEKRFEADMKAGRIPRLPRIELP